MPLHPRQPTHSQIQETPIHPQPQLGLLLPQISSTSLINPATLKQRLDELFRPSPWQTPASLCKHVHRIVLNTSISESSMAVSVTAATVLDLALPLPLMVAAIWRVQAIPVWLVADQVD